MSKPIVMERGVKYRDADKMALIPVKNVATEREALLRKPEWMKIKLPADSTRIQGIKAAMRKNGLHSVCEEASCPNLAECFNHGTATFMILGAICTRRCPFCDVAHGRPVAPDANEPVKLAQTIADMALRYVVITSVDRDDLRDGGATFEEACTWAENNKLNLNHWFFVSDLDCLKRGGRVSATSALIATALKICPVMNVDYQGKLIPREKIRTKKKAIATLVDRMMEHVEDGAGYTGKCSISQSACREDAEEVARLIGERIPALKDKIVINNIGTVIGSHTGPGTVALFFMGDKRAD